ncbi:hypothetical protein ABB07_15570 [Streptomyces incarnatus]|uniref:Cation/H+ exchanger domain-containing protein n=1 Tax=Streptomyces incarnatus TaxID=665007 RepID=A0ABN4GEW9_9ACTN|nr:hypothetical protein [Streptomyces incarnatus]AKJ11397.1 hypothetical protein ABB07_15570 [Streptomyces incarnatus]
MATLLTGILLGILLSRTAAGLLSGAFGRRAVSLAASGTPAAVAQLLVRCCRRLRRTCLPDTAPSSPPRCGRPPPSRCCADAH